MKKYLIGIIGCGNIANSAHIPSYIANEKTDIKYFCDINPAKAEACVEKYNRGLAVTNYLDVIGDPEIDAVSICTPNDSHHEISIAALHAGKDVLCEKPVARTYDEALLMLKAQNTTGKILNIGVVNRFNKAVNMIKSKIDSGELGTVHHVYISFRSYRSIPGLGGAFTTRAISGGGALIDWGVHFLDIVMYCCGDPVPKTVSGEAFCVLGKDIKNYAYEGMWAGPPDPEGIYDVDDSVTAIIRTQGPVITLNGAWAQNIGEDEMFIDFMGDKAGIRLQYGKNFTMYSFKDGILYETKPKFTPTDHYQEEINSFIHCIQTKEKNAADISTAIITAKMMQAIYDSSDQKKEIVF